MTIRISRDPIYRRRRFSAETIELCVRWYITYRLSYRDRLVRLGVWTKPLCLSVAGATIYIARWIGKGSPSRHCSAITEVWSLRRRFFVRPSLKKASLA